MVPARGPSVVSLDRVSVKLGGRTVLKDISLDLERGKLYVLIGKNGAGKSTLMKLLMRKVLRSTGDGQVLGHALDQDPGITNARIGYVTEAVDYQLPFNISRIFNTIGLSYPDWDQTLFEKTLQRFGIDENRAFQTLSRGQRMQVTFAAAISIHPQLILLDEITSVLDASARSYVSEYLARFTQSGGTVLVATNIVAEIQGVTDHLILIDKGRVRVSLPVKQILDQFIKLRLPAGDSHPVFEDPRCIQVAMNSDFSFSYVMPRELLLEYPDLSAWRDRRFLTAEEVFIYYTRDRSIDPEILSDEEGRAPGDSGKAVA